jgi:hypothetical protein
LPEQRAADFASGLAALDAEAPAALVPLLADPREPVAAAAELALARLSEDWRRLPPDEAAVRFRRLAHELAEAAPGLPAARRRAAQHLAARLLVGPLDQEIVADCEVVLRLAAPSWSEETWSDGPHRTSSTVDSNSGTVGRDEQIPVRVAAQPAPITPLSVPPADFQSPAPIVSEPQPPEPRIYGPPLEPERLIDASQERPIEPRQLRRPKAMKIEG